MSIAETRPGARRLSGLCRRRSWCRMLYMDAAKRLATTGEAYENARSAAERLRLELHKDIVRAVSEGVSEVKAAELGRVDRMTVRSALGKR